LCALIDAKARLPPFQKKGIRMSLPQPGNYQVNTTIVWLLSISYRKTGGQQSHECDDMPKGKWHGGWNFHMKEMWLNRKEIYLVAAQYSSIDQCLLFLNEIGYAPMLFKK
jgi:hypothetical protein